MANEAILRVKVGDPFPFTVADNVGIEKGALLKLVDARTASGTRTVDVPGSTAKVAGIAAREKVSSDGRTELGVWRSGWFDCTASGAITAGDLVSIAPDNHIIKWVSGAGVLGIALETASDDEVILVDVRPTGDQRQQ